MDEIVIVAMIDRSMGNESVGEAWTETAVFPISTPMHIVYKWAMKICCVDQYEKVRSNIRLSIGQKI